MSKLQYWYDSFMGGNHDGIKDSLQNLSLSPTLVGPFPVTYRDITGLNPYSQGFYLKTFDSGDIVLDVWAVPVIPWNNVDARLQLCLTNPSGEGDYVALYQNTPNITVAPMNETYPIDGTFGPSDSWDAVINWAFNIGDNLILPARIRSGGANFVATLDDHTGTPTEGQIDVYALYVASS